MIHLKDGRVTRDIRCDLVNRFDQKSKDYSVGKFVQGVTPRNMSWDIPKHLDQGAEGACAGFGTTHVLLGQPNPHPDLDAKFAREKIYWEAQEIDPWPGGAYPGAHPFYEGTDVLDAIKIAQRLGFVESFHWAFSLQDFMVGLSYVGPALMGTSWLEGMCKADDDGFVHATGRKVGGHCYAIKILNVDGKFAVIHNSWGSENFGIGGDAKISLDDIERLLYEEGQCAFLNKKAV